jgi:uncharacterized membrane protein YhaH (DUF805 family)
MGYDWKRLFLSADGRITREEFWVGFFLLLGVSVILRLIPVLGLLATLALIYPQVCIGSKRLHDMGQSGFLMILPYGILAIACIAFGVVGGMAFMRAVVGGQSDMANVGAMLASMGLALGIFALGALFAVGFTIWVGAAAGQIGENRYGPQPQPPQPAPVAPV